MPSPDTAAARYTERYTVPWWAWPASLTVGALLAAQVHSGYGGLRSWVPYVVAGALVVLALVTLSRGTVRVTAGELQVLGSRLPLDVVGAIRPLDVTALRTVLREGSDPAGYHVVRGWTRGAVQVRLDDPADETPYWLVSTRHPQRLVDAVAAERDALLGGGEGR